ncbi:hypothetical protein QUF74_01180 [Candidatus Halobeggiatoa sp. HSG11]|nr:hypothetical protein [Candidatus Halobeggiatoa sp. HSG11]
MLENILTNTIFQFILALSTLIGGVVAFIQMTDWLYKNNPKEIKHTEIQENLKNYKPSESSHKSIFTRVHEKWRYEMLHIIYANTVSLSVFIELIKLSIFPVLLLSIFSVVLPYWLIMLILFVEIGIYIFHNIIGNNANNEELDLSTSYGMGAGIMLSNLLSGIFIYVLPEWTIKFSFVFAILYLSIFGWPIINKPKI